MAQKKTDHRHRDKPKHKRFTDLLKKQATQWLEQEKLSPELISGRWRVQGTDGVSHEAIYQWIWTAKHSLDPQYGHLCKELKHGRRKRKRGNYNDNKGILCNRVSIQQRSRFGDLEIDLMMGKAHKSALLVITDRATLITGIEKVTSRKADSVGQVILNKLSCIPTSFIKTLTVDNDKAFADHENIARQLNANVYFTRPFTSQDKGTVENRIGVIGAFPTQRTARHLAEQELTNIEGGLRVKDDMIVVTYYRDHQKLDLARHYQNLPQIIASERVCTKIP